MNNLKANFLFGKYKLKEFKGEGATAQVWSAEDLDGNTVALKIFAPRAELDNYSRDLIKDEFERTKTMIHSNLMVPLDYIEHKGHPALVMKLCEKSMWQLLVQEVNKLKSNTQPGKAIYFSEYFLVKMINHITSALDFLHNKAYLHNDVKPANILVNNASDESSVEFYLTDFGITKEIRDTILRQTKVRNSLTFAYASPEKLQGKSGSFRSDIFSLGASVYELINGIELDMPLGQILNNLGEVPPIDKNYSGGFKNLIFGMLKAEPYERLSSKEILEQTEVYLHSKFWPGDIATSKSQDFTISNIHQSHRTVEVPELESPFRNPSNAFPYHKEKTKPNRKFLVTFFAATLILSVIFMLYYFKFYAAENPYNKLYSEYDSVIELHDDLYIVSKDGLCGVVKQDGEIIREIKYIRCERNTTYETLIITNQDNSIEKIDY